MPSASESQATLRLVTGDAVADASTILERSSGSMEQRRLTMLDTVPAVVGYYAQGSAALAADFYEESRAEARVGSRYTATLVIVDRTVRIRRGIAWAAEPLADGLEDLSRSRLAEVVQLNTARPYRDTVTQAVRKDPEAAGWRRYVAADACKFCQFLAARGGVYKRGTVDFAAHDHCHCSAGPVFSTDDSIRVTDFHYTVNGGRIRTPQQKAKLRDLLNAQFPDARG